MTQHQHAATLAQFSPQAAAYVSSAVHAAGPDLEWMAAQVGAGIGEALDLGCGGGHVAYRIAPLVGALTACDLSSEMLAAVAAEAARRGLDTITTVQAPAEALPFADGRFDLIACRFTAHHWADLAQGLREAARVLRPGGRFVLVDGCSPGVPLWDTHLQAVEVLRDPSHVRDYGVAEWSAALTAAGLLPTTIATHQVRMDFPVWIARMRTPPEAEAAIRYLQAKLPADARRHFAVEEDGSFMLDTLWVAATKP
jgi:SAM-dependent methyltransferase